MVVLAVLLTCHAAGFAGLGLLTIQWLGRRDWSTGRLLVPMTLAHLIVAAFGVFVVARMTRRPERSSTAFVAVMTASCLAVNAYGMVPDSVFSSLVAIRIHQAGLGGDLIVGDYPGERLATFGVVLAVLLLVMLVLSAIAARPSRGGDGHIEPHSGGHPSPGYTPGDPHR
ncbi:hypothetical protein [Nocardia sp. NPDC051833]|uniref:hypothetical protein n=1 Tax=Nocardia sp. NPDC051833 TaxID=3155674 RepID=UPI00342CED5B